MMSLPDGIKPRKLADEVQERLLRLIREDGLGPGDALPSERELMARYEIGRPAIREAMQALQHRGVIEIRHGGRPRVAEPSLDGLIGQLGTGVRHLLAHTSSMDHLKEARAALEAEMARIAARRRTEVDIASLEALLAAQELSAEEPEKFLEIDGKFHRRIAAISANPIFETLAAGVFDWLRDFHAEAVRKRGLEQLTLTEHRAILDAIAAGDEGAAAKAMRDHLERANELYHQDHFQ
ncbi:transcriptional regulator NanR [Vannielia litorea]|uniref:transcriptional regulator NanR n=1 Tax=Vannielia litorea TaxID=1217970 RepID=UPI001BD0703B|nr:transcriptional regulator NanR [Vannielia litorea]MBS8227327.1 transcriptional regulator NanR [Vannielia litorea]